MTVTELFDTLAHLRVALDEMDKEEFEWRVSSERYEWSEFEQDRFAYAFRRPVAFLAYLADWEDQQVRCAWCGTPIYPGDLRVAAPEGNERQTIRQNCADSYYGGEP